MSNNVIVHKVLCTLHFVSPNYPKLTMDEDLIYISSIPLTVTSSNIKTHFSSVLFVSVVLCYVSTSEKKYSPNRILLNCRTLFFFLLPTLPFPSLSSSLLFLFFCSLENCFVFFLPVKFHTSLMTTRLKSTSMFILVSVLLYSYVTIF